MERHAIAAWKIRATEPGRIGRHPVAGARPMERHAIAALKVHQLTRARKDVRGLHVTRNWWLTLRVEERRDGQGRRFKS